MLKSIALLTFLSLTAWVVARGEDPKPENKPAASTPAEPGAEKSPAKEAPQKEDAVKPGEKKKGIQKQSDQKKNMAGKPDQKVKEQEREAAALVFAGKHHPELVGLIEQLKGSSPKEYQHAVRELARTADRLTQIQQKEPKRYELELNAWKISSRVRLLAARLTMSREPALEQELRDALSQQIDVRLQLLQLDQEEMTVRLKKLDATIETTRTSKDQQIQQSFENILRNTAKKARPEAAQKQPPKKVAQKNGKQPDGKQAKGGAAVKADENKAAVENKSTTETQAGEKTATPAPNNK